MNDTKVDHYQEAQRLLEQSVDDGNDFRDATRDRWIAQAHVHALLALTDAQSREADADEVLASAVDPQGGRKLRIEARA